MIVTTLYERHEANTATGYTLEVKQIYSSHDKTEIDVMEKILKSKVNDCCVYEIDVLAELLGGEEE